MLPGTLPRSFLSSFNANMRSALQELAAASDGRVRPGGRRRTFASLTLRGDCVRRLPNEDDVAVFEITEFGRGLASEFAANPDIRLP